MTIVTARQLMLTMLAVAAIALLPCAAIGDAEYHSVPAGRDTVAAPAAADIVLSNPRLSTQRAEWFIDRVLFQITVDPPATGGTVAVLFGEAETCIGNLNDLGWPPDVTALDGEWAGYLEWARVPAPAVGQPVVFAYQQAGETLAALPAGNLDLFESTVAFRSFSCEPNGAVQVSDDLVFSADTGLADLPGQVYAVIEEGTEILLSDNASPAGDVAGDGIYTGRIAVPVDLPWGEEVQVRAEYRSSDGVTTVVSDPVGLTLQPPEVYLTELTYEPAGPVEIGEYLVVSVRLNKMDEQVAVQVLVDGPGIEYAGRGIEIDGTEYAYGGRQFTGKWDKDFEWPYNMTDLAGEYRIYARITSGGRVVSTVDAPPLKLLKPDLQILTASLTPASPVEVGQWVFAEAETSRPVRIGGLRLMVNGNLHGRLTDSGGSHYEDAVHWEDEKYDGICVGPLNWYSHPNYLAAGENQSVCLEYVVGETVYATYELPPLTILPSDIRIMSVYQEPAGPVRLGEEVEFVVDLNKETTLGYVSVELADGTQLCGSPKTPEGDRVVLDLNWHKLTEPGDLGPVVVRYWQRGGEELCRYECDPLVVLPAE